MAALHPNLRRQLQKAVVEARRVGEEGAAAALRALAVDAARAWPSMPEEERMLRVRLRAHGRQLGDRRDRESGTQEIGRLAHEVAYEHWHRMLFVRFLAENGLLVHPRHKTPVTLEDCEELAREGQGADRWAVAESFAAKLLPAIFRPGEPVLAVRLAPEHGRRLERLVEDLPSAVFAASDSLGWSYQYWQEKEKGRVNDLQRASQRKIGPEELPAVTQLFTENYMVRFLLHNTVGAWRAGRVLARRAELVASAKDEAELAAACRIAPRAGLPAYDFEYLRFVREPVEAGEMVGPAGEAVGEGEKYAGAAGGEVPDEPLGPWRPAAGAFPSWPDRAADLRVLDPCCGSGHFLTEGLELLVGLRMEEEDFDLETAIRRVLRENLFGLELDPRCAQIAAFNLAFAAWRMAGRPFELPPLQVACVGLVPSASREEWLALARGDERLEGALHRLHELFAEAGSLGALIDPKSGLEEHMFQAGFEEAEASLARAVDLEDGTGGDGENGGADACERAAAAQGMSRAARILAGEYHLVITNVPYLARGKQGEALRKFAEVSHPDAKADLATVFLSRSLGWLGERGAVAVVAPQNWLFLTSYRKLRERLLRERTWRLAARLGEHAFESSTAAGAFVAMTVISAEGPDADWCMSGIDVSAQRGETPIPAREKAELLRGGDLRVIPQEASRDRADSRLALEPVSQVELLETFAVAPNGMHAGDYARFRRFSWELPRDSVWRFFQRPPREEAHYSGRESVFFWPDGGRVHRENPKAYVKGEHVWGRRGVIVGVMRSLRTTLYEGDLFDISCVPIVPRSSEHILPTWCFCSSNEYGQALHSLDPKLNVTNATLAKVPFDLPRWFRVATEKYPNGLPEPYSDDPTQWLFHGHPCGSVVWDEETKRTAHGALRVDASVLQVAVCRLLGYRWPPELDAEMRLAAESREWVERCRELDSFADVDGIVCLHTAAGELPAADRLRSLLAAAYGEEWSAAKEQALLAAAAAEGGKAPVSLADWLRDRYFEEHCKLFHSRPFVWHVWDGRKDGFHALVNCHRLCGRDGEGRRTLEALAYHHLGEWVARQRTAQAAGEEGADARLAAALDLQGQLALILEGEPPLDLFVRWRPLHEQPLGWAPNLDDGVRLNIRPFLRSELQTGGRKGAGVLRAKPNVRWSKDRGKEPASLRSREDFPWFYSCPGAGNETDRTDYVAAPNAEYDGIRWNDLHYTRAAKEAARWRQEARE